MVSQYWKDQKKLENYIGCLNELEEIMGIYYSYCEDIREVNNLIEEINMNKSLETEKIFVLLDEIYELIETGPVINGDKVKYDGKERNKYAKGYFDKYIFHFSYKNFPTIKYILVHYEFTNEKIQNQFDKKWNDLNSSIKEKENFSKELISAKEKRNSIIGEKQKIENDSRFINCDNKILDLKNSIEVQASIIQEKIKKNSNYLQDFIYLLEANFSQCYNNREYLGFERFKEHFEGLLRMEPYENLIEILKSGYLAPRDDEDITIKFDAANQDMIDRVKNKDASFVTGCCRFYYEAHTPTYYDFVNDPSYVNHIDEPVIAVFDKTLLIHPKAYFCDVSPTAGGFSKEGNTTQYLNEAFNFNWKKILERGSYDGNDPSNRYNTLFRNCDFLVEDRVPAAYINKIYCQKDETRVKLEKELDKLKLNIKVETNPWIFR